MAQQLYTLEEAAQRLKMSPDELKALARRGEVHAVQGGGSPRFRPDEIDALAKKRSGNPDLGDDDEDSGGVFNFDLNIEDNEAVDFSMPSKSESPSSKRRKGGKSGSHLGSPSGSDSDVRLVPDGSDIDFAVSGDPGVKLVPDEGPTTKPKTGGAKSGLKSPGKSKLSDPKSDPKTGGRKSALGKRPSKLDSPRSDSGVRLVLDTPSDSDVKIVPDVADEEVSLGQLKPKSASDSDIRLEHVPDSGPKSFKGRAMNLTEEIDLDAEMSKSDEQKAVGSKPSVPALPTDSPFELKDSDLDRPSSRSKDAKPGLDSSGEFELTPSNEMDASPLEIGSDELNALTAGAEADSDVALGELTTYGTGSGVRLAGGDDAPIRLLPEEDASPNTDFELNLDGDNSAETPPKSKKEVSDSSGEFELNVEDSALERGGSEDDFGLNLDDSNESVSGNDSSDLELTIDAPSSDIEEDSSSVTENEDSSSEFELSMDAGSSTAEDSEASELELSLDEAGSSAVEQSSEFELSLEGGGESEGAESDSSSEFELSLDAQEGEASSNSEFELSLEASSDSEFELALQEGQEASSIEDEEEAPAAGEKDIFETDFNVPALDEESESEAVAVDEGSTDLEESDEFGVAIEDEEIPEEDPSGSQVVAMDEEEETDDAAATVHKRKGVAAVEDEEEEYDEFEEIEDVDVDYEPAEEEEGAKPTKTPRRAPAAQDVPWGPLPAILMVPTFILTLFVGLMIWETLNLMWGNNQGQKVSGVIAPWLAYEVFGMEKPDKGK